MSYFDPIDNNLFKLGDLGTFANRDITDSITEMSISLTLNGSSEVSVSVIDVDFAMAKANYFQVRRDVFYRDIFFELTAVSVSRSESIHPLYELECRSKAVQLMKRDKRPEAYNGISAFELAKRMASRYNMHFFGEPTAKKQAIVKAKSSTEDDSVWTVLQSLAGEQEFICFESQNTLFFTSEKYLLGKWGDPKFSYGNLQFIPFIWPEPSTKLFPEAIDKYILLDMPDVRRSDDDIKAASGSMLVDRTNGKNLRPGMTIYLGGIPDFEGLYIISDVSFSEGTPDPIQVQFRTPVEPKKENISSGGTSDDTTKTIPDSDNPIGDDGVVVGGASLVETREYTAKVLARTNYSGSNANVILNAVNTAVTLHGNKKDYAYIERIVKASTKLTPEEKDLVLQIYAAFVQGLAVTSFAIAGGLSAAAIEERKNTFLERERPDVTNVTPARGQETGAASGSGGAQGAGTRSLMIPTQTIPNSVNTQIENYINQKAHWLGSAVTRPELIAKAKSTAGQIYALSTVPAKIARYQKVRADSYGAYRYVYDALRQESVVIALIGRGKYQSFEQNYPGLPAPNPGA